MLLCFLCFIRQVSLIDNLISEKIQAAACNAVSRFCAFIFSCEGTFTFNHINTPLLSLTLSALASAA